MAGSNFFWFFDNVKPSPHYEPEDHVAFSHRLADAETLYLKAHQIKGVTALWRTDGIRRTREQCGIFHGNGETLVLSDFHENLTGPQRRLIRAKLCLEIQGQLEVLCQLPQKSGDQGDKWRI